MSGLLCTVLSGCTSISVQSNKDAAAVHKVSRLFILINGGDAQNQELSNILAADLVDCFSNKPAKIQVCITSPLDLDDTAYRARMMTFMADSILTISPQNRVVDPYGGFPTIVYDASLFDPATKKREWRASITNSGGTEVMGRRMRKMAESIVSKLELDGFL